MSEESNPEPVADWPEDARWPSAAEIEQFWNTNLGQSIRGQYQRIKAIPSFTVTRNEGNGIVSALRIPIDSKDDPRGSLGELFERIADPSIPFPGREFAIKKRELMAWLVGVNDSYKPTLFEELIIWPAYLERMRRMKERALGGDPSPLAPDAVADALKVQKNQVDEQRVFRIRDLLIHLIGYDEHGTNYGKPVSEQSGLGIHWRPMRHELRKQARSQGRNDRELFEAWLDHLEFDGGFNRTDVLNTPLAEWKRFFLPAKKESQTGATGKGFLLPGADLSVSDSRESPLTANDRFILQAMLEINADAMHPRSAREIVRAALSTGDEKRAFDNLKRNGLVEPKRGRGGGFWLTQKGKKAAEELAKRE